MKCVYSVPGIDKRNRCSISGVICQDSSNKRCSNYETQKGADDPVNHPAHYTSHPSGVECIQITEHMGFCLGNAVKYIWRADLKNDAVEDLKKARFYIERELAKRAKE